eukprot:221481-Pelagomonas_calceolata.AAC.3
MLSRHAWTLLHLFSTASRPAPPPPPPGGPYRCTALIAEEREIHAAHPRPCSLDAHRWSNTDPRLRRGRLAAAWFPHRRIKDPSAMVSLPFALLFNLFYWTTGLSELQPAFRWASMNGAHLHPCYPYKKSYVGTSFDSRQWSMTKEAFV